MSNGTTPTPMSVCSSFDPANAGTSPTFTYACQMPGAKLFTMSMHVSTQRNTWMSHQARPWSLMSTTGSGTDPTSGCVGTWYTSLSGATSNTTVVCYYLIECDYEFRNPL
jgi:hypothetical protein